MKINQPFQLVPATLALLMAMSGASMAMSLKLPSSAELSGKWQMSLSSQAAETCVLHLNTDEPPLSGDSLCAERWLHEEPTGWFPTPDGLALTGKEGTRLIQFNHLGNQHYEARLPDGRLLTLDRLAD